MDNFDLFDMFGDQFSMFDEAPGKEKKEETNKEEKAIEVKSQVKTLDTVSDDVFEDAEDEGNDVLTSDDEAKKKASPKKSASKKASKKTEVALTAPVTVIGTGFKYTYGIEGSKVTAQEAAKAAFAAGYKEIANASVTTDEKSTVFVSTLSETESGENTAIADNVQILIGDVRVDIAADDLGCPRDQASVGKLTEKFVELYPSFAGCGLKYDSRTETAFPVFFDENRVKLVKGNEYSLYSQGQIIKADGEAFDGKGEIVAFMSEDKTVFLSYKGSKSVLGLDFGLDAKSNTQIEEKWAVDGLIIYLETWGVELKVTPDDFGGKDRVSKDDVIAFLKPRYSAFKSTTRKFDVLFDRNSNRLGIAMVSGTKGAALAAPSSLCIKDGTREERTAIGTFKGDVDDNGNVSGVSFSFHLPKMPLKLLEEIIWYFRKDLLNEAIVQIYYNKDDGYYIRYPEATASKIHVSYQFGHSNDVLVATIHSHNTMEAKFSSVDDADEIYTGIFGVVGTLHKKKAHVRFRAGMEGSFAPLKVSDIFDMEVKA